MVPTKRASRSPAQPDVRVSTEGEQPSRASSSAKKATANETSKQQLPRGKRSGPTKDLTFITAPASGRTQRCDVPVCWLRRADLRIKPWLVISSGVRPHCEARVGASVTPSAARHGSACSSGQRQMMAAIRKLYYFAVCVGLEIDPTAIRQFLLKTIPGALQTPYYPIWPSTSVVPESGIGQTAAPCANRGPPTLPRLSRSRSVGWQSTEVTRQYHAFVINDCRSCYERSPRPTWTAVSS